MRSPWTIAGAVFVLIGVAGLIAGGRSLMEGSDTAYSKSWTFDAHALEALNIRSDRQVKVTFLPSTDGADSVSVKGEGSTKLAEAVRQTQPSGGELKVDLREPKRGFFDGFGLPFHQGNAEIVVKLTDEAGLRHFGLQGDSGRLEVSGVRAESADVESDSGSVELRDLAAGKLRVHADSGSIKGSGIRADSAVSADSGSILLEKVTGAVRIQSDSGSVKLYRDDTADTDIGTDSGSICVRLPASFAGIFDLKSDSGHISAPSLAAQTNDRVKAKTDSGSVKIELESEGSPKNQARQAIRGFKNP